MRIRIRNIPVLRVLHQRLESYCKPILVQNVVGAKSVVNKIQYHWSCVLRKLYGVLQSGDQLRRDSLSQSVKIDIVALTSQSMHRRHRCRV